MDWLVACLIALGAALTLAVGVTITGLVVGWGALWWLTAIYHVFRPERPPGANDNDWSRDQGREVK